MDPTGRVALVTGAARGIGAATVVALAADGWSVLAVDLAAEGAISVPYALATEADLAAVATEAAAIAGDARRVAPFPADVRSAGAPPTPGPDPGTRCGRPGAPAAAAGAHPVAPPRR